MVLKESLQVLLTILGEEEGVDLGTELLESPVGWSEESSTFVLGVLDSVKETCFLKTELKCGELAR